MSLEQTIALVERWAPRFGFGHYRKEVRLLPEGEDCWARIFFEHEEEWFLLEICADGTLPADTTEHLVLHELSHGLLTYAEFSDGNTETVCNRIARIAMFERFVERSVRSMNEHASQDPKWWEHAKGHDLVHQALHRDRWLSVLVDSLPERQREVLTALYWDGCSLRELARRYGVHLRTVGRWRDEAIALLRVAYDKLEEQAEDGTTTD